jgi:hypothetical protein
MNAMRKVLRSFEELGRASRECLANFGRYPKGGDPNDIARGENKVAESYYKQCGICLKSN